ncbi:MAG: hypothetical protein ACTSYA_01715 [Candidatus Kariarchaeaceae archaeon]
MTFQLELYDEKGEVISRTEYSKYTQAVVAGQRACLDDEADDFSVRIIKIKEKST